MKKLKNIFIRFLGVASILYLLLCVGLYFFQEKLIFFPQQLPKEYVFSFEQAFEELEIPVEKDVSLRGVIIKAKQKGKKRKLIFYLHGNVGAVSNWQSVSNTYTNLGYDVFILDYRGYGKSDGKIQNQEQFFEDIQKTYDFIKEERNYEEQNIIVVGYSIGTASAAMLSSQNNPHLLILKAPYFSLIDMTKRHYPFIPTFLLKYKFQTADFLASTDTPTYIFHGTADRVVPYESSLMIQEFLKGKKSNSELIVLENQSHGGIHYNSTFLSRLKEIL